MTGRNDDRAKTENHVLCPHSSLLLISLFILLSQKKRHQKHEIGEKVTFSFHGKVVDLTPISHVPNKMCEMMSLLSAYMDKNLRECRQERCFVS